MAEYIIDVKVNGVEQSVKTIGELEAALRETNGELNKVESSSQDLQNLTNNSTKFTQQVEEATIETKKLSQALNSTTQAAGNLNAATPTNLSEEMEQATSKSASLRAELRKITQELYNLEPGSERFKELSLRAGELRDQMADTSAVVGVLAGNVAERLGGSLELTLTQGVAALQGLQAGFQAAGIESEGLTKALNTLQGVIGLVSLVSFAGGLPDTISQIKAGFSSLSEPITAYIRGLFATTAATEGATIATRALSVAQKALPILAIASLLATGIALIVDYTNKTAEAAEAEKARAEALEKEKVAQEEFNSFLASETKEFTSLIFQLKASNAGSKERINLIKEANSQYGTTFQNLKDETKFQEQLNRSVDEYIELQYERFKLEKNKDQIGKLNAQRLKAEQELEKLQIENEKNFRKAGETITKYDNALNATTQTTQKFNEDLAAFAYRYGGDVYKRYRENKDIIEQVIGAQEKLGLKNADLTKKINDLTDGGKKYEIQTNNNTKAANKNAKATDDQITAYNNLLLKINEFTEKANMAEADLEKQRQKRYTTEGENLGFELDVKLSNIIQIYQANKKSIEDTIKDEVKKTELLKANEESYLRFATATQRRYDLLIQESVKKNNDARLESIKQLRLGLQILTTEITFGNQNTQDTFNALLQENLQSQLRLKEEQIATLGDFEIAKENQLYEEKRQIQEQLNNLVLQSSIERATKERNLQVAEIIKYYDALEELNVQYNEKTGKINVETNKEYIEAQKREQDVYYENLIKLAEGNSAEQLRLQRELTDKKTDIDNKYSEQRGLTEEFLTTTILNLNKELNNKLEIADNELATSRIAIAEEVAQKIGDINFSTLENLFQTINEFGSQVSSLLAGFTQEFNNAQQLQISELERTNAEKSELLNVQYNSEILALQQRYNQGLITQQQYNEAAERLDKIRGESIDALDKTLLERQKEAAREAFERNKSLQIAQTTIQGIQTGFEAFASGVKSGLPPPLNFVLGGVLAAAVATQTALTIANIKKQKFDASAYSKPTQPVAPGLPSGGSTNNNLAGGGLPNGGFTSFNTSNLGQPATSGATEGTGQAGSQVQKVVVVESDITAAQRRVAVLEGASTFI